MEWLGSSAYEEMDSISRILFNDEADFTLQQLFQQDDDDDDQRLSYESPTILSPCDQENSNAMAVVDDSFYYLSDPFNSNNVCYLSQETTYGTTRNHIPAVDSSCESVEFIVNGNEKMDSMIPILSKETMEEAAVFLNEESLSTDMDAKTVSVSSKKSQLKRKAEMPDHQAATYGRSGKPKKKSRVPRDAHRGTEKSKKNMITDGHVTSGGRNGLVSTSYSSDCESQDLEALSQSEETRATRGCATDPQSLYARKRRERINERLKILQNLVPNGTKVDISTMLEEAVHYVKFLQLQIKLLSSDDMWMYAPISYNGIDIGLDRKIPHFL